MNAYPPGGPDGMEAAGLVLNRALTETAVYAEFTLYLRVLDHGKLIAAAKERARRDGLDIASDEIRVDEALR